jgi:glucose-1-phosphatase
MSRDIQLVVFDLGRVLVRICRDWRHACEVARVPAPAGELAPDTWATLHDLVCRVEVGQISTAEFCRRAAPALGLRPDQAATMWNAYTRGTYPGAVELLDELRAAGVATACLSNTNATHWALLGDPAGHSYFPFERLTYSFASHLLRLRKPDDAIYAHVESAVGVPGGAIVFFDDVPENVDAARRRGWHAYRIDPAPDDPIAQIRAALKAHGLP